MPEVIIVGSGTGAPSLSRGAPCLVVATERSTVLIDSGPGAVRELLKNRFTYLDPDILLYTHTHPDHVADLVPFLFACKYAEPVRGKDLLCVGGPGFRDYFEKLRSLYGPWIEPGSYHLTIQETSQFPLDFRDLKISSEPMAHLPGSVGYRIEFATGQSMAVSGDTAYCANLVELASGVDLLVLECSFPEGMKVEGHLTPSLAGRIAVESKCRRLALTHLYPVCALFDVVAQCREVFEGEVILAEDGLRIRL